MEAFREHLTPAEFDSPFGPTDSLLEHRERPTLLEVLLGIPDELITHRRG